MHFHGCKLILSNEIIEISNQYVALKMVKVFNQYFRKNGETCNDAEKMIVILHLIGRGRSDMYQR